MGAGVQGWLANSVQDGPLTLWGALWPRVQGGPKVQGRLPRLPTGRASHHSPEGTAGWTQGPQNSLKGPAGPRTDCRHRPRNGPKFQPPPADTNFPQKQEGSPVPRALSHSYKPVVKPQSEAGDKVPS